MRLASYDELFNNIHQRGIEREEERGRGRERVMLPNCFKRKKVVERSEGINMIFFLHPFLEARNTIHEPLHALFVLLPKEYLE